MREDAEKRARQWLAEARRDILADGTYTHAVCEMTGLPLTEVACAVDWALTEAAPTVSTVADLYYDGVQPLIDGNEITDELREAIAVQIALITAQLWSVYTDQIAIRITSWAEQQCLGEDEIN